MTNEEAIKVLMRFKELNDKSQPLIVFDAIDVAIAALERESPKKPYKNRFGHLECPACGWIVESFNDDIMYYPFCPNCGQAIDWNTELPKEENT